MVYSFDETDDKSAPRVPEQPWSEQTLETLICLAAIVLTTDPGSDFSSLELYQECLVLSAGASWQDQVTQEAVNAALPSIAYIEPSLSGSGELPRWKLL